MPFQPTTSALNHLLAQSSWALPRYACKTVQIDMAPLAFACTIPEDGTLRDDVARLKQRLETLAANRLRPSRRTSGKGE